MNKMDLPPFPSLCAASLILHSCLHLCVCFTIMDTCALNICVVIRICWFFRGLGWCDRCVSKKYAEWSLAVMSLLVSHLKRPVDVMGGRQAVACKSAQESLT